MKEGNQDYVNHLNTVRITRREMNKKLAQAVGVGLSAGIAGEYAIQQLFPLDEQASNGSQPNEENRNDLRPLVYLGAGTAAVFPLIDYAYRRSVLQVEKEQAPQRIRDFAWEHQLQLNTKEKAELHEKLSYLPPLGGKIPLPWKEPYKYPKIEPTVTLDEQIEKTQAILYEFRRGIKESYVHQVTVQGRLPDNFKYAALSLVVNSPYPHDWSTPFFEAPWGKIAPLIHDGYGERNNWRTKLAQFGYFNPIIDQTNNWINPVWNQVSGRTDFLQRIVRIYDSSLPKIQNHDIEAQLDLSDEKILSVFNEQIERQRTREEMKFYQHAALALHAAYGTAPRDIPADIRIGCAEAWQLYESKMKKLLKEFELSSFSNVPWFLPRSRHKPNWELFGKRYEADWEPIQEELYKVEETRLQYDEFRYQNFLNMSRLAECVDKIIGLP